MQQPVIAIETLVQSAKRLGLRLQANYIRMWQGIEATLEADRKRKEKEKEVEGDK